jgi:YcxB-like protein
MPIQAEGTFTAKDIARGSWTYSRRSSALLLFATVLAFCGGVFLSITDGRRWLDYSVLFASGLYLLAYSWPVRLYRARRLVARSRNLGGIVRYEFDDDGWRAVAPNAAWEIKWTGITKWIEGRHSYVIYADSRSGTIIPKRFFQNSADVDAFRDLLQAKVKKK